MSSAILDTRPEAQAVITRDMFSPRSTSRVLVCDGEQRTALAVVRSLGRAGHRVAVCSHITPFLSGISRFTAARFDVPNPWGPPGEYLAGVRMAATAWAADVVMPVTDQSCATLLRLRESLAPSVVPGPSYEAYSRVSDKRQVLACARSLGIPVPEQVVVESAESAGSPPVDFDGPYAIKSTRTMARYPVLYAEDMRELAARLDMAPRESFPLLVQRRIIGPGVGVFLLMQDGEAVATFAHERLRERPPSGGASVYARSVRLPPAIVADALRLLRAHDWCGAAMVEFKREAATGVHYLMEINGRLWGSLQLAIDAGVDFPKLILELARGGTPEPVTSYRSGIILRSLLGDIDTLLSRMRHTAGELDMPPGAGGRLAALRDFLKVARHERLEVGRLWDFKPFFFELHRYLQARLPRNAGNSES